MGRRRGFTLIELLVVVAIIGLLAGLLLPAVLAAREAARRATCLDHLHQVGLALALHESTHKHLPALYNGTFLPRPRTAIDEFHFHSWRSALLPQLEQAGLLASLNLALPATTPANQTAVNTRLEVLICPSSSSPNRDLPGLLAWNDGAIPVAVVGRAARSDYEAVGGVRVRPHAGHSLDLRAIAFGAWGEPTYNLTDGHAERDRLARLADITDGLSQTVLVGERAGRPDLHRRGEPVEPFPYRDPSTGTDPHQAAWAVSTHFLWTVARGDQAVNQTNSTGFFSFHPAGAHAVFADGSVRFLRESTSPAVLTALITRAGAEVVDAD